MECERQNILANALVLFGYDGELTVEQAFN